METQSAIILIIVSIILLFALPVLQFLAFGLVIFFIVNIVMAMTCDGDLLLMLYEKWGQDGSNLRGKVAWVTGASSGIGEALAYELARKDVKLILSSRREKELERVKEACLERSGLKEEDILILPMDVLDYDSHRGCAEKALHHFQKVDILVNNAGRSQRALCTETSLEVDKAIMNLNFIGQVSVTKSVLPHMIDRSEGHIVNITSTTGKVPVEFSGTYNASKHALHGYFGALAYENDAINVTNVCPGPVESNITQNAFGGSLKQPAFKSDAGSGERATSVCMSAERCASLIVVAVANKLSEVWICKNLVMLNVLLSHWSPLLAIRIKKKVYGNKRIDDFKKLQVQLKNEVDRGL